MATVPPHIFRAYDIRGKADTEITGNLCALVGKAFGSELQERYAKSNPTVIVGRDARTHSPALEKTLIDGFVSTGCHVKTIGQTPTPVNYFAVCHFGADGSVQVTASHNDKEDNGLKLQTRNAKAFSGEELQKLRQRIEEERFVTGKGTLEELDAVTPYLNRITSLVPRFQYVNILKTESPNGDDEAKKRAMRVAAAPNFQYVNILKTGSGSGRKAAGEKRTTSVVADFGNGVAGPVYTEALKRVGVEVIPLFAEPDGTFPNHIADPTKRETLKDLQRTVVENKADCGIAFDGDGDRVGFVDERGNVVAPDSLLLLLAEDHLRRNPGAAIVYTVSMSGILETEVKRMGGVPVMTVVGHSAVEEAMREHGSHLGGEQSGHFFCGEDFYNHDDALVAALRVLSIFSRTRLPPNLSPVALGAKGEALQSRAKGGTPTQTLPFSSLFSRYPKVHQSPEWRPRCPDDKKTDVVRRITQHFQSEGYPCITIDGVRIDFGESAWALIRQSNTAPRLSVCMEARSPEKLREIEGIVRGHLKGYNEIEE